MHSRWRVGALAALLSLSLVAAACGDDGGTDAGGDDGSGNGGNQEQVEAARERAEAMLAEPTEIRALTPLEKAPEPGKTIAWLQCSQSSCGVIGDGVTAAAEKLGWTVKRIDFRNEDPESIITAMDQAIDAKPDAIALSGVPSERYEAALERAHAAEIPVITGAVIDEVGGMEGNGIIGLVGGSASYEEGASIVADWVIADSGGDANILAVTADDFPIIKFEIEALQKHVEENCDDCTVTVLNQAVADIATNTPNNVVSALQENPDIDYVYFGFGDLSRGVAPAVAGAGIEAKIVGLAPVNENLQRLMDGEEHAWASWATSLVGWGMVDGLARFFNGEDMEPANNQPLTFRLFTADSPPEDENPIFPTNYEDLYADLWQVG